VVVVVVVEGGWAGSGELPLPRLAHCGAPGRLAPWAGPARLQPTPAPPAPHRRCWSWAPTRTCRRRTATRRCTTRSGAVTWRRQSASSQRAPTWTYRTLVGGLSACLQLPGWLCPRGIAPSYPTPFLLHPPWTPPPHTHTPPPGLAADGSAHPTHPLPPLPPLPLPPAGGNTALHGAAAKAQPELLAPLLAAGADVHIRSAKGWTAAQAAASAGSLDGLLRCAPPACPARLPRPPAGPASNTHTHVRLRSYTPVAADLRPEWRRAPTHPSPPHHPLHT
jgi:hypothetical protein